MSLFQNQLMVANVLRKSAAVVGLSAPVFEMMVWGLYGSAACN
jgi:hypothetical protein